MRASRACRAIRNKGGSPAQQAPALRHNAIPAGLYRFSGSLYNIHPMFAERDNRDVTCRGHKSQWLTAMETAQGSCL
jgi:hypothetical protein